MPNDDNDWPIAESLFKQNWCLVVFTSKSSKQASEGLPYEWKNLVENQCELS